MKKQKTKQKRQEEKLINEILERIRKGSAVTEQESEHESESDEEKKLPSAKRLKELRTIKESLSKKIEKQKIHHADKQAQNFISSMREAEERAFNEMTEAVNAETEQQRVRNLVAYLKKNRKKIPERLIINLHYFPYLQKYYLLADAEIRGGRVNGTKLKRGYLKFLPAPKKIDSGLRSVSKKKKKIAKKIAATYFIDVLNPTEEEKQAIQNLLEISEGFGKLYKEFQKL